MLLKELQSLCLDVELIEDPTMPRDAASDGSRGVAGEACAALAREVADTMAQRKLIAR